ncbi:MAG: hypothetical protein KDK08_26040 [Rhizobiaceae bacterium]|nr:hypothetical protein [Rhizobiaceae bacterium]
MQMKVAGYVAAFIGGLVVCYLLLSLGVVDKIDGIPGAQEEPALSLPTYLSFISVMMTAVTAVLAAVAIFIGIVAAMTFRELSDKAEAAAQKRADEALSDEVIIARIDEITFRNRRSRALDELEEGFDPTDTGDR